MPTKQYDIAVFIGRFQPFHNGHLSVIQKAFEHADQVIVLVGSSNAPRTIRNPWTFNERAGMIWTVATAAGLPVKRLFVLPLEDAAYNDAQWIKNVQTKVSEVTRLFTWFSPPKVALIGHSKDASSYYLKMFPQWGAVEVKNCKGISATDIRDAYFEPTISGPTFDQDLNGILPKETITALRGFRNTKDFTYLMKEGEFIRKYREAWDVAPYPPTFVTVDACVVQSGHILLVQRKAAPGEGLWALPGGFLNQDELIEDAMIRELREETRLKVPAPVLKGSIVTSKVFDEPSRSARGRTITHAYLIRLRDDTSLPEVKASSDARKAIWLPLAEVRRDQMFEDHFDIIQNLTAQI